MFPPDAAKENNNENNLKFNSGDFEVDLQMGKLVDGKEDDTIFRNVVSLNDLYSNFVLNQSIYSPFMALDITITESKRILEHFGERGLQGEEWVKIKFQTPTLDVIEDLYYVTGYSGIDTDEHETQNQLILKCVSKEKLINDQSSINQAFNNTTDKVAETVYTQGILRSPLYLQLQNNDGWTKHFIEADEAQGIQSFIIPGISPFKAAHFCAVRSNGGSEYPGSFYTFYQTQKGFHFKNVEKATQAEPKHTYTYDSGLSSEPRYSKNYFYNIRTMSPLVIKNTLDGIQNGQFASTVRTVDHLRKNFFDTTFNMKEQRSDFNTMGDEWPMTTKFFDVFASDPLETTIVQDTFRPLEFFSQIQTRRVAYRQMLNNYMFDIVVNGDTRLQVGETIKLELKEASAKSEKPMGSMYSGRWFIVNLVHICDKGLHTTKLTIIKDGLHFKHEKEN